MIMERLSEDVLPQDLWAEVLARVPVKSLLQLRCVCKSWLSLIDSPSFVSLHLSLTENNRDKLHCLSLEVRRRWYDDVDYTLTNNFHTFEKSGELAISFSIKGVLRVMGYVNGLMLILRLQGQMPSSIQGELLLWNPSIRKTLMLPSCPVGPLSTVFLDFDPSSDDYKVAVLNLSQSQAAIYDLRKGSWRTKSINHIQGLIFYSKNVVFSKGAVHWIAVDNRPTDHMQQSLKTTLLASFDFSLESFRYGELPCKIDGAVLGSLFALGDSLALFEISPGGYCIWVMEEHDRKVSWTKLHSGGLCLETYAKFTKPQSFSLLYVEKSGTFLTITGNKVFCFDAECGQLREVLKESHGDTIEFMNIYLESLVLNGCDSHSIPNF